ncbi:TorD/DmsD family molecular chaperone [Azospirillum soli]|uniref:TorD/DmsD family molecular chaperone n=1 Tax=Azospirillum soli TaxID=1304799 RepID=UPI001AE24AFC|nr:molecular chaperone TorD family protein [Azospirillum soli]MBP2315259.1 TorA maturation chaperone TorD [Azospirillum soli]
MDIDACGFRSPHGLARVTADVMDRVMEGAAAPGSEASPVVVRFGQAAAADLRRLARLHDREPTAELLEELREQPLQDLFGLTLDRPDAEQAMALIAEVAADLPCPIDGESLEELAADFASIHRTDAFRAGPRESVWGHAEAVSQVAAWHLRFGFVSGDPRDPDHLVPELRFLAELLDRARPEDAAAFLDQHPLRWVPDFCGRIAAHCRTPYFAGVALLTGAYLDQLRDRLERDFALLRPLDERRATERKGTLSRKPEYADPWA